MRLGLGLALTQPRRNAFSPLDLQPALWLDAADTSTITAVSGSVSQWSDKSGNGYHVTQSTAAAQPTTGAATLNGRNVLSADGGDSLVSGTVALPSGNSARHVFAVAKRTSEQYVVSWGTSATNQTWAIDLSTTGGSQRIVGFANDWATGQAANTTWEIAQAWHDGTNARYRVNAGAVRGPSSRTYATAATPLYVAKFTSVIGAGLVGEIAEILIFARVLNASEQAALLSHLATKWGITL